MRQLLFATKSKPRHALLEQAKIPFMVIEQYADETQCDWGLPLEQLLISIATHKMDHIVIPKGYYEDTAFILTADTMGQDKDGMTHGKPTSKAHAIAMIKDLRRGGRCGTAFCLDRKKLVNGIWELDERIVQCPTGEYTFSMPDHWIERYLQEEPDYMNVSGAIDVQGYGAQFLQSVHGSYGAFASLPMFEIRKALEHIGFFKD